MVCLSEITICILIKPYNQSLTESLNTTHILYFTGLMPGYLHLGRGSNWRMGFNLYIKIKKEKILSILLIEPLSVVSIDQY